MATGTCVGWFDDRGYGFVRPDTGGADIFVHRRSLRGAALWLEQGQRVQFEISVDPKVGRTQALNVEAM